MADPEIETCVAAIRDFNRFYMGHVGALDEHLLDSPFTLTECRVLTLTAQGRAVFEGLDQASRDRVGSIVEPLERARRDALLRSMRTVRGILDEGIRPAAPCFIRPPRMGDVTWITHRQTTLYRDLYGWNARFEKLLTEIMAEYLNNHDPACEGCWVAEQDGTIVGSVFLVRAGPEIAKLRMLYVEPEVQGAGIGRQLVEECMSFARQAGYRRLALWTNDVLAAARRLYDGLGFTLVSETPHSDFGPAMVGQVLECDL